MPSLRPRWPSPRRRPPTTEVVGPVPAGPGSDGSHDGTGTPGANRPPRPDPDPVTGIVLIDALLDKAVTVPSSVVHGHVARLRERNPHASPTQVVRMLERQYLLAVSTSGGATGAVAAAPGIGTGTGLALTGSEIATFFATSSAFALAVADVHGIAVEDTARRRALLLATVLGEHGAATVGAEAGLPSTAWARTPRTRPTLE